MLAANTLHLQTVSIKCSSGRWKTKLAPIITAIPKVEAFPFHVKNSKIYAGKESRVNVASASGYIFWIMTWNLPAEVYKKEKKALC